MGLDDLLGDRQAEAGILAEGFGAAVSAVGVETLEDALELIRPDAGTVVLDDDLDAILARPGDDADDAVLAAEGTGVVDEIVEHLAQPAVVAEHEIGGRVGSGEFQPDLRPAGRRGVADDRGDGQQQLAEIDRRRVLPRQFGVKPRSIGDVADQAVEAPDIVQDDSRQARLGVLVARQRQCLDGAAQRSQRILDLMRDVGGETFDRVDAVVERTGHLAESLAEVPDLVAALREIRNLRA